MTLLTVAFALLPGVARAYCACACVGGTARNVCSSSTDVEIICNKLCPTNILPPGSPQFSSERDELASETGRTGPQEKFFIDGKSQ